jgi:hypothetical protein
MFTINTKFITAFVATVALIFATSTVDAQITSRGTFMIGGELGLSSSSSTVTTDGIGTTNNNATQFNIAPSIGYFFANNLAIGVGIDYTLNTSEDRLDSDLLFGPFVRYYIPFGDDKALFFEADFGYGNTADRVENNGVERQALTQVFAGGIGPGFTIFSNDAIGIEALAKYKFGSGNSSISTDGNTTTSTSITHAFDFSVGLQVYFTRVQPASR